MSVEQDTSEPLEAYAGFTRRSLTKYRDGWLPDLT